MADTDLIACLYPFVDRKVVGQEAENVVKADANENRRVPPRLIEQPQLSRRERESTPLEQQCGDVPAYFYRPGLELRFSHGPQTPYGFVFHHFALTFDDHYRPIIKDLGSFNGTEVTYDKQGEGKRSDFVWIIGGHEVPQEKKAIVININKNLKFQIVAAHHDITSPGYIDNVNRFRQGTANAENLFGRLDLRSRPQTELASGAHTPGTGPIVLRKHLGEGTFGVVTHLWDVSTADECALKEPSEGAIWKRWVSVDEWMEEARIMRLVSHDHIVTFIDSDFTSLPRLRFEYVPGGTLENYTDLSTDDCLQILCQCLSALVYLHGQEPPIVHRDIKPSNILVQHRHPDDIHVKLGDFGLSREGPDPATICGSWRYLAPEVHNEKDRRVAHYDRRSYTLAVDIWSLGVTVFECAYDLPSSKATGVLWCKEIVKKLRRDIKSNPDDLKQFLWDAMVILQPRLRGTAQSCYNKVLLLADSAQDRSLTPTPAAYAQGYHQPVSQYPVEDQQTILLQDMYKVTGTSQSPSLDEDSAELRRYTRSNGPPPDSVVSPPTRKRTKDSRSSSNRCTKRYADPVDDGPNGAQLSEVFLPDLYPYLAGGNAFVPAGAQVAVAPTDSEEKLAAKLLIEISQGR
ncbi:kinase-like domain protein [Chaetomidium leptoderma]|uniref:non-specific serine/threonine protein kinase n=1 Tax=Chaetomidium leptoderma TaxID=669021 RepID=A0AAN6ZTN2_9PEZI|nr:kinase-like domain protein [Chaetomidium leptoderma]